MADNVNVNPGNAVDAVPVATDEIGGKHYQRIKIGVGADGSAADLDYGQETKAGSLPVVLASDQDDLTIKPTAITMTDRSGAITTGGTSQEVMAANTSRKSLLIVNISDTQLWVNFGTNAVQDSPSIPLEAASSTGAADGGSIEFEGSVIPTQAINIIGPTTGKKFVAKEA
jgi:hypothetical protein